MFGFLFLPLSHYTEDQRAGLGDNRKHCREDAVECVVQHPVAIIKLIESIAVVVSVIFGGSDEKWTRQQNCRCPKEALVVLIEIWEVMGQRNVHDHTDREEDEAQEQEHIRGNFVYWLRVV
jgi:hypothetical protein